MVPPAQNQGGVPLQPVIEMRSKGVSDHMIIDELTKKGYASIDIFEALTQADNQSEPVLQPNMPTPPQQRQQFSSQMQSAPQSQPEPQSQSTSDSLWNPPPERITMETAPPQSSSPFSEQSQRKSEAPDILNDLNFHEPPSSPTQSQNPFPARMQYAQEQEAPSLDMYADKLDEIAEAIIDEKWKEMKGYIEKMVEWKSKVESRILKIESENKMLRDELIALQKGMMDKVQTYDRHITDVATEIKAMERVFQKIIPSLTENVTELSRVVHHMKDKEDVL
jgi:hypothetical protein